MWNYISVMDNSKSIWINLVEIIRKYLIAHTGLSESINIVRLLNKLVIFMNYIFGTLRLINAQIIKLIKNSFIFK
jgi:hypothetical protein